MTSRSKPQVPIARFDSRGAIRVSHRSVSLQLLADHAASSKPHACGFAFLNLKKDFGCSIGSICGDIIAGASPSMSAFGARCFQQARLCAAFLGEDAFGQDCGLCMTKTMKPLGDERAFAEEVVSNSCDASQLRAQLVIFGFGGGACEVRQGFVSWRRV